MALVVKDRVKETTSTTGTGTLTLAGAVAKFQSFSVVGDGNTTYYAIESGNGSDWEVGVGTYTASGTTLSRDTILESSNGGTAISLSGTSTVFCTYPAERSVNTADIGTTIQAYDATILKSADIGTSVQGYDADTAKYDDTTANFTGTLQNGGSNVLVDTDIGSTVQGYDATIVVDADIGVTVQGYDADTAKYDDTTANFTGTLQNGGSNVVVDSDVGSTVQAYDADTTKNDVANTFTANQTINGDLTVDTNTLYVDSTNNRVGVGTTTPDYTFHVKSAQVLAGVIESTDTNFARLRFQNANTTNPPYIGTFNNELRLNTTSADMVFQDGATEYMRIDSSGNVGIGTSSPTEKLDVEGSINFGLVNAGRIYSTDGTRGSIQISAPHDAVNRNVTYGNNYYLDSDNTYKQAVTNIGGSALEMSATNGGYGEFSFRQKQDPDAGGAERVAIKINTSGNVGIGESSPSAKLDVLAGALGTTSGDSVDAFQLNATSSNQDYLRFRKIREANGTDWQTAGWRIQQTVDVTNMGYIQFNGSGLTQGMSLGTSNTERMRIDSSGNVGIGTSSPSYKLDVSGVTKSTSFLETVYAVTGTTPAIAATNGNIQTWTLSGNSTPTDSLNAGESITLMIDDGSAYTITWTSLVDQWIGGSAPTLATTGYTVVELWKVSTTVYGAYVGDAS